MRDWEPGCEITLESPGVALGCHLKYSLVVPEPYDIDDEIASRLGPTFLKISLGLDLIFIFRWNIANNEVDQHDSNKNKCSYGFTRYMHTG